MSAAPNYNTLHIMLSKDFSHLEKPAGREASTEFMRKHNAYHKLFFSEQDGITPGKSEISFSMQIYLRV